MSSRAMINGLSEPIVFGEESRGRENFSLSCLKVIEA